MEHATLTDASMALSLRSLSAELIFDDLGGLRVVRGGAEVLRLKAVFIEALGVRFPVVGTAEAAAGDGTAALTLVSAARGLPIRVEARAEADGFSVAWTAPPVMSALGLALDLAPGGPWYGMGERLIQTWPLTALNARSDPYAPIDTGRDGSLNLATPLWLSRAGVGLLLDEDPGELAVTVNQPNPDELIILRRSPARLPAIELAAVQRLPARLTARLLLAAEPHTAAAQHLAVARLGRPSTAPPRELFIRPIWTTWARFKMPITQAQTLAFADEIVAHDYPRSVMEIDDRWQAAYGDLAFDPVKFPDPRALVDGLHARGFRVTLWVPPFLNTGSAAFREAAALGHLLRDALDDGPAVVRWWQGNGGLLDLTSAAARDWWLAGLRRLQADYGVDGYKFDAGEAQYVPRGARAALPLQPHEYADYYVDFVARHFEWTEVRCGWRSQRHGLLFREYDKWSRWGFDNGLHAVLTQALTLSVLGYPFVLPDMIGGNAVEAEVPDAELMIRWTQLTALMPSMQFSLAPWDYGAEAVDLCRRYARLHEALAPFLDEAIAQTLADGTPLVRPLFWDAPEDEAAYTLDDEFTLGGRLLAAPVLLPGQRARRVYLPAGRWRDYWTGQVHAGPLTLDAYPAPLETLLLFERV
jgi:hypothetical protein